MVMSLVYPTLKPMLEASIRKIHGSPVEWQNGGKGRAIEVVEFVTNPMQAGWTRMRGRARERFQQPGWVARRFRGRDGGDGTPELRRFEA